MRKVFWCSLATGVMLAGGVFTVAHFAARHPQSVAGRALFSAGRVVVGVSPLRVLAPLAAEVEKAEPSAVERPPVGSVEQAEEAVEAPDAQVSEGDRGAILIPETDPVPVPAEAEQLPRRVAGPVEVECPACPTTRAVMPYCHDEAGPGAAPTCEALPMPSVEEDGGEGQEEGAVGATGPINKLFRLFEQAARKSEVGHIDAVEPTAPTQAGSPEAPCHRHTGCSTTGKGSVPCPATAAPACPPPPAAKPGSDEASEHAAPEGKSALRAIRRFNSRGIEDGMPTRPQVDTMEYRPSDAQLYDFGPGSL